MTYHIYLDQKERIEEKLLGFKSALEKLKEA